MTVLHRAAAALAGLCLLAPLEAIAASPLDTFDSFEGGRAASRAQARAPQARIAPLRVVLQAGYDAGHYETGYFGTNDNDALIGLHLHEGPNFGVGFSYTPEGVPASLQVTVGYERSQVSVGNQEVAWSAVPVETIGYVQLEPIRLGVGLSQLILSSLKTGGGYPASDVEFDPSTGLLLELGWVAPMRESARGAQSSLGFRYVFQKVRYEGFTFDASAVGVVVNLTL